MLPYILLFGSLLIAFPLLALLGDWLEYRSDEEKPEERAEEAGPDSRSNADDVALAA